MFHDATHGCPATCCMRLTLLVEALCYKPKGRGFDSRRGYWFFFFFFFTIYLILPGALVPEDYLASNRNEYQKQKKMFLGSRARLARKAENLAAIYEPIV
jgi:hypothetical protein